MMGTALFDPVRCESELALFLSPGFREQVGSHSLVTVRSSYYLSLSPNSDRSLLVLSVAILWLPFQIGSQVSHSREAREAPLFGRCPGRNSSKRLASVSSLLPSSRQIYYTIRSYPRLRDFLSRLRSDQWGLPTSTRHMLLWS